MGSCVYLSKTKSKQLSHFLGEYHGKLDPKNRVVLPSALVKQMAPEAGGQVVLKKGLGAFLVIYPLNVWLQELDKINRVNQFNQQGAEFRRRFLMGASAPMDLDSASRFLVSKNMLEHANLKKDVVLLGDIDKIELWDRDAYEHYLQNPDVDEAALAAQVLGKEVMGGQP
jgi:MraZ protein